jgi:luciferase family oxidoreductase group 1
MNIFMTARILFSVLDFAPVRVGETPRDALHQTVDLARAVEALGFTRFWVVEHHGAQTFASAATPVVIGHIAGKTSTIRVGSGGVMLPNHSPLVVAEQFGTLESLYPGRIDLGVGRSSGTVSDDVTRALRATPEARERFPSDLREMQLLFRDRTAEQMVRAVPGAGLNVPIWLLGSSTFSAQQAAMLGLPFAFAMHIGGDSLDAAIEVYRSTFKPSEMLSEPYVMVAVLVTAAETDEAAQLLFTSFQQLMIDHVRGTLGTLQPPTADLGKLVTPEEESRLKERSWRHAITGSASTVERRLQALVDETAADELMVLNVIHDQNARHLSFRIVADVRDRINARKFGFSR